MNGEGELRGEMGKPQGSSARKHTQGHGTSFSETWQHMQGPSDARTCHPCVS